ncbi:Transcription elongation factor spt6 [Malassezia yamatoensis]|uniref:Transcription elongation factor spt6 n=1 Tax=Malassezia yamatoensis TaxID=253288 RepID=A0AAJ5YQQ9_9BASI|nr:Transcription elongation factor spt6 [Malassezia yamatoensis]
MDGDAEVASQRMEDAGEDIPMSEEEGDDLMKQSGNLVGLDSSDEEDDEEDEEEQRRVAEGFIVDEDVDEEANHKRKRRHHQRRREELAEELDEDDLALLQENQGPSSSTASNKRARQHDDQHDRDLAHIFDDEDDSEQLPSVAGAIRDSLADPNRVADYDDDELDDFIEDDEDEEMLGLDEEAREERRRERREERRRARLTGQRVDPLKVGIDPEAWDEIHDIFGNGEDYAWALGEEDDEESEIQEDDRIKQVDIPERIQLAFPGLEGLQLLEERLSDQDLDQAAQWASSRISARCAADFLDEGAVHARLHTEWLQCVRRMLGYMLNDYLEVSFLTQHRLDELDHSHFNEHTRKYETIPLLLRQELLTLSSLGIKFKMLRARKESLRQTFGQLQASLGDAVSADLRSYFSDLLAQASSFEEVTDINEWLAMQFGERFRDATALIEADQISRPLLKKPTVVSEYERLKATPLAQLAVQLGLSAQQLAANVASGVRIHLPEDPNEDPAAMADAYIDPSQGVSSADQALQLARTLLAHEIGKEPLLRRDVRSLFRTSALMDVEPTDRGMTRIDESHPYYNFKFLRAKPVAAIVQNASQFLQIVHAEEERLVRVTLRLPTDVANQFESRLQEQYVSEGFSDMSQRWNAERSAVMEEACAMFLLPLGRIWTREWLMEECREALLRHCEQQLTSRVEGGPYQSSGMISRNGDPDIEVLDHTPRVLAVSDGVSDPRKSEVVAVFLDQEGRFLEHVTFDSLRPPTQATQMQRAEAMERGEQVAEDSRDKFVNLIKRRRPDAIIVNGFSARTMELKTIANELSRAALNERIDKEHLEGRAIEHARMDVISVFDDTARLYQNTERAKFEFPELSILARYCIGLARYAQSPVNEYAALGNDLSAVQFDPAQRLVPSDRLRMHLERAIVMLVNDIGVDVNAAVTNPYVQKMLPYVAGLGPRKAHAFVHAIRTKLQGSVVSRAEMLKQGILSFNVWNNYASFLRLDMDAPSEGLTDEQADVLDSTRIHPEDYDFPRQMARDALNKHEEDLEGENPSLACQEIMQDPHPAEKLATLDLDNYAQMLFERRGLRKRLTLFSCRQELIHPFEDWRPSQTLPNAEELFTIFTGETRRALSEGYVVPVSVIRVEEGRDMEGFVRVRLDSGIEGIIAGPDIMPGYNSREVRLRPMFRPGQTLNAVVIALDMHSMRVELSVRPEAFEHVNPAQNAVPVDTMYFDHDRAMIAAEAAEERARRRNRNRIGSRVIDHPNYINFSATQAQTYLATQPRGTVVIRPSSRGMDHLAATWKVEEGVYQHIDVLELDKESDHALGRILRVADMGSYSDLDDLIVNHIRPMAAMVEMMINHEKYKGSNTEELHEYLTNTSLANPTRSVYAFGLNRERPGYFDLAFKANASAPIQTWPVKVLPGTFKLGHATQLADMAALCNAFKTQYAAQANAHRGGRTPAAHGAATPGGARTPAHYQSRTPGHYGGRTPGGAYGGRTPGHYGAQTPGYGGATPGRYGAATPGHYRAPPAHYGNAPGPPPSFPGPPPVHPNRRW